MNGISNSSVTGRLEDKKFLLWAVATLLYLIPMYYHGYEEWWIYIYPAAYAIALLAIQVLGKEKTNQDIDSNTTDNTVYYQALSEHRDNIGKLTTDWRPKTPSDLAGESENLYQALIMDVGEDTVLGRRITTIFESNKYAIYDKWGIIYKIVDGLLKKADYKSETIIESPSSEKIKIVKMFEKLLSSDFSYRFDVIIDGFICNHTKEGLKKTLEDANKEFRLFWDKPEKFFAHIHSIMIKMHPIIEAIKGALNHQPDYKRKDMEGDIESLRKAGIIWNKIYEHVEKDKEVWPLVAGKIEKVTGV